MSFQSIGLKVIKLWTSSSARRAKARQTLDKRVDYEKRQPSWEIKGRCNVNSSCPKLCIHVVELLSAISIGVRSYPHSTTNLSTTNGTEKRIKEETLAKV